MEEAINNYQLRMTNYESRISFYSKLGFTLLISAALIFGTPTVFILSHYNDKFTEKAECAVIFGAAVWRDNIASHAMADRVMEGVALYKKKQVSCLILSGGESKIGVHETEVMRQLAISKGVPENTLRLDFKGKNTLQTLKNLPEEVESFVMVSNDFHLARIKMLSRKLGLEHVQFHASGYLNGRYAKEPYFFLREVGAMIYYFW